MSMSVHVLELFLILLFFLGSWFFSGFESGMVSMNRHRLVYLIRHGDKRAKAIATILRDSHRMLATTLVGNNICNVTLSTLVAALAVACAQTFHWKEATAQTVGTLAIAVLLLVIGEFLPKLWFTARPLERCRPLLPVFVVLRTLLYPLASLCMLLTRMVTPRQRGAKRSPFISRESLAFLMRDSEVHGQISAFERTMINRVLDLQLRRATQIMTPMSKVVRVYESDNLATVLRVFRQSRHRVLPLFSDDGAHCLGVLHLFDLLRSRSSDPVPFDLRRQPVFVKNDLPADELLPYMRVRNTKILIVNNLGGRPVGIVTQEDVLNAVLDDELLRSSTDRRSNPQPVEA